MNSRRGFCRSLAALTCVGVGGCKIDPILAIDDEQQPLELQFPDLPPQIPDLLRDDESTLLTLTKQLLTRESALLRDGALAVRTPEDPRAVDHLVELMRSFGVYPAGNRGDWRQPVPLDIVEPTGGVPILMLRPDTEPARVRVEPKPTPDTATPTDAAPPDTAPPDASPPDAAPPAQPPPPTETPPTESPPDAPVSLAIDLVPLGAFRQRGPAQPHTSLQLSRLSKFRSPFPADEFTGRVALIRAPDDLELDAPDAPARVDALFSAVRDAGALGCLVFTDDPGPGIEAFTARWQRQVRNPTGNEQPLLIEGLLAAPARKLIDKVETDKGWMLDVDLATRNFEITSFNVLAHVIGRIHPGQAVVMICDWDTPDPATATTDTTRLLTTLAAFFQLAEWSRRSTPPKYSVTLLLTVNAGFAAGSAAHAAWSANFGMETEVMFGLDRPTTTAMPEVALSGRYDTAIAELARRAVAADGRELLLADRLGRPALTPYLRYPPPVMTIGAPGPDALDEQDTGEQDDVEAEPRDTMDDMLGDVHMLRNLALALATRR